MAWGAIEERRKCRHARVHLVCVWRACCTTWSLSCTGASLHASQRPQTPKPHFTRSDACGRPPGGSRARLPKLAGAHTPARPLCCAGAAHPQCGVRASPVPIARECRRASQRAGRRVSACLCAALQHAPCVAHPWPRERVVRVRAGDRPPRPSACQGAAKCRRGAHRSAFVAVRSPRAAAASLAAPRATTTACPSCWLI